MSPGPCREHYREINNDSASCPHCGGLQTSPDNPPQRLEPAPGSKRKRYGLLTTAAIVIGIMFVATWQICRPDSGKGSHRLFHPPSVQLHPAIRTSQCSIQHRLQP